MTVFLVSAPMDGSADAEALGALRRADVILATPGALDWVTSWTSVEIGSVVAVGVERLPERLSALLAAEQAIAVVLADGDDLEAVSKQLSVRATLRPMGLRFGPSIHDGSRASGVDAGDWIRARPLLGWSVMVTRPAHQATALSDQLTARGARALSFPVVQILPPPDPARLDQAAASVDDYDWIVFTSTNAVSAFQAALFRTGQDAGSLAGCRIAAIGPSTAAALKRLGVPPDVVPTRFVAESLLQALGDRERWGGLKVLLPRAAEGRAVIPEGLSSWGADVDVVAAYRTAPDTSRRVEARRLLNDGLVDIVTFTASSAVRAFRAGFGGLGLAQGVAIGPITAATAAEEGIDVVAVAEPSTTQGLVDACERLAERNR